MGTHGQNFREVGEVGGGSWWGVGITLQGPTSISFMGRILPVTSLYRIQGKARGVWAALGPMRY